MDIFSLFALLSFFLSFLASFFVAPRLIHSRSIGPTTYRVLPQYLFISIKDHFELRSLFRVVQRQKLCVFSLRWAGLTFFCIVRRTGAYFTCSTPLVQFCLFFSFLSVLRSYYVEKAGRHKTLWKKKKKRTRKVILHLPTAAENKTFTAILLSL